MLAFEKQQAFKSTFKEHQAPRLTNDLKYSENYRLCSKFCNNHVMKISLVGFG